MVLVLVAGDAFVPQRAADIPQAFRKLLSPGRVGVALLTGNLGSRQTYEFFTALCPKVHATRGEYDLEWTAAALAESTVVEVEGLRIGLLHGHQVIPAGDSEALAVVQRNLGVDVLVTGATHVGAVTPIHGFLHVDPGSITGAFSPERGVDVTPSFALLDVTPNKIVAYLYEYYDPTLFPDDDPAKHGVKIRKHEWHKAA